MPAPHLSVIVLTRNEEANVEDAIRSLLEGDPPVEVLVVDSASRDRTVEIAGRVARELGEERVRVVASERDIPIGEARNLGVRLARAPRIAFMSADATAAPGWAAEALGSLDDSDVVYGRQVHTPPRPSLASVCRGLRYHHFRSDAHAPPETYASNVNAAIRRSVFDHLRYVDDGPASALDDILFTREAMQLGYRVGYNPRMLVRHKDVSTLAGEWRKNRREGYGWGILAPQLGLNKMVLAWGGALAAAAGALVAFPGIPTLLLAFASLYASALRRVARAGGPYLRRTPGALLGATLLGPAFDIVFLIAYVRGLARRRGHLTGLLKGRPTQGDGSP